jgi:hypothetical protein
LCGSLLREILVAVTGFIEVLLIFNFPWLGILLLILRLLRRRHLVSLE